MLGVTYERVIHRFTCIKYIDYIHHNTINAAKCSNTASETQRNLSFEKTNVEANIFAMQYVKQCNGARVLLLSQRVIALYCNTYCIAIMFVHWSYTFTL